MNIPCYLEKISTRFTWFEDHFYKGFPNIIKPNNTLMSNIIEKNSNIDKCVKLIDRDMWDSPEILLIKIF
jgi:hypothetical protein